MKKNIIIYVVASVFVVLAGVFFYGKDAFNDGKQDKLEQEQEEKVLSGSSREGEGKLPEKEVAVPGKVKDENQPSVDKTNNNNLSKEKATKDLSNNKVIQKSTKEFGHWGFALDEYTKINEMYVYQNVKNRDGAQFMSIRIGCNDHNFQTVGVFSLPLGVSLVPGFAIQVDEHKQKNYPFTRCAAGVGCQSYIPLDDEIIEEMKKGKELSVGFKDATEETVVLKLPLDGFSSAYKEYEKEVKSRKK